MLEEDCSWNPETNAVFGLLGDPVQETGSCAREDGIEALPPHIALVVVELMSGPIVLSAEYAQV